MDRGTEQAIVGRAYGFGWLITVLGIGQIFAWGSSYYLLAVLAKPIADDTGWPLAWVVGGVSVGLLVAGIVSPRVGRTIQHRGGRPVLAVSTILLAVGLGVLAIAQTLPVYLLAWIVLGIGMGAGLYDPAFATLGRLYGAAARSSITTLTLFGGFASTVCWPISAVLVTHFGWRGTCLIYAAFHLIVLLPAYLRAVPREAEYQEDQTVASGTTESVSTPRVIRSPVFFGLLATTLTLSAVISTLFSVHLLTILQSRGIDLAVAVALGAVIGPLQFGARAIEFFIARYHHPVWTQFASTLLVGIGVAALWMAVPVLAVPIVFYGAGIGLESIARGTLPLALFAGPRYAVVMGRLAMPSRIAQAAAPPIGAALLGAYGPGGVLATFVVVAGVNFALATAMLVTVRIATAKPRPRTKGSDGLTRPSDLIAAFVAAFNRGDPDETASFYAEDAINHQLIRDPVQGRTAIREMLATDFVRTRMVCIAENIFEDGHWAILEWKDGLGLRGCSLFHIQDDKIVFQRGYWDRAARLCT
jgi:MFS family permease